MLFYFALLYTAVLEKWLFTHPHAIKEHTHTHTHTLEMGTPGLITTVG